ncbi:MAG: Cell division protein FtsZ [Verrucomicrobiota bacterium]|jgi:cell division protein FtsZ
MERAPSILLVGLGGAGCAMVTRLAPGLPADIRVLRVDTDARSVAEDGAAAVQIGRAQTRGMGTGGEPAVGAVAAEAEEPALRRAFTGVPLVVLVTGLGGGTGSGASAVVARQAADAGATVLAFATMPFSHEGERRMRQANEGAVALGQKAHGLVLVHNDLLLQQVSNEAPLSESFAAADAWVGGALRALAAAFEPGALVPVDPAALRSILASPGSPTLFAYGVGAGPGAAATAARAAGQCPLAHGPGAVTKVAALFVYVAGGPAMTSADAFEAVAAVRLRFGGETTTLLCARIDPALGERVEVSVLGASLPAPKAAPKARKGAKAADADQPLFGFATEETLRRGLFGGTPMTFIEGQDVDVPTYIRKAVRLPAG